MQDYDNDTLIQRAHRRTLLAFNRDPAHNTVPPTFTRCVCEDRTRSLRAVRLGSDSAALDNRVLRLLRTARKVVLEDRPRARGVAPLRVERRARVVRRHPVARAERVLHLPPGVVARRRLHVPHVARVPGELPALQGGLDRLRVADRATRGVDEICALPRKRVSISDASSESAWTNLLEVLEQVGVDEPAGALVEGCVDGDNVTLRDHLLEVLDAARPDCLLAVGREVGEVEVQVLLGVERRESLEHTVTDAARADRADDLALEVERVARDLGDLPVTACDLLVRGHEVAHEEQDAHHDVLSDRGHVRARHLDDIDVLLGGGVEVNMVGTDTGGDRDLEVLGL